MTIVARSRWWSTASRISSAVCTGTKVAPAGGVSAVGPETRVTSAPRRSAAVASPYPILPDDRVGALGHGDVLDGVGALRVEEVREHRAPGQGPERERADELARVLREADRDRGAEPGQLAQQVDRLVRGDRAGDAQDQLTAGEAHGKLRPWARRPLPSRGTRPWPPRSPPGRRSSASCAGSRHAPRRRG